MLGRVLDVSFWCTPVRGLGLVRLRVGLGLLVALSAARLLVYGWVTDLFVTPSFHFSFAGFSWIKAWPEPWMTAHVVTVGILGVLITIGVGGRWVTGAGAVAFTYVELIDKAPYLNHYYLISLLLGLLTLSSVTTAKRDVMVPRYELWAFRAQIAAVYFFAGVWKLNPDWMFRAEPLSTWLWGFQALAVVGPLLGLHATALFMAWAGAAFDLCIWAFLLWRPTSRVAYAVCVAFHVTLWLLFPIGVFSWVMILAASVLLPVRTRGANDASGHVDTAPTKPATLPDRVRLAIFAAWIAVQLVTPLRALATPGNVNWHEQGYRFSWRVMLNEKAAHVEIRANDGSGFQPWPFREELTPLQARQMGFQPDMLLQYAHHICAALNGRTTTPDVRIDARVAWNARRSAPLLADVNLCLVEDVATMIRPPPPAPGADE